MRRVWTVRGDGRSAARALARQSANRAGRLTERTPIPPQAGMASARARASRRRDMERTPGGPRGRRDDSGAVGGVKTECSQNASGGGAPPPFGRIQTGRKHFGGKAQVV